MNVAIEDAEYISKYRKDLGLRIIECRERKFGNSRGSSKRCADALGISPQKLSDIESVRNIPSAATLAWLSAGLGADPGYLLTGQKSGNAPGTHRCRYRHRLCENLPMLSRTFAAMLDETNHEDESVRERAVETLIQAAEEIREFFEEQKEKRRGG